MYLPLVNIVKQSLYQNERFTMNAKELIAQATSLPVEDRALITESLLKSLNAESLEITEQWIELAKERSHEIKTGKVIPVSAEKVFADLQKRFDF